MSGEFDTFAQNTKLVSRVDDLVDDNELLQITTSQLCKIEPKPGLILLYSYFCAQSVLREDGE